MQPAAVPHLRLHVRHRLTQDGERQRLLARKVAAHDLTTMAVDLIGEQVAVQTVHDVLAEVLLVRHLSQDSTG